MKIIGICGLAGSGKDTIANSLIGEGFRKYSFASVLKDLTAILFCWPRNLLEGDTKESRDWREQIDTWWSARLGMPNFTPRLALQLLGTEVFRKHFHNDIWILSVEKQLSQKQSEKIIITDCRFPNELKLIHQLNGKLIQITRGSNPEWWNTALQFNLTNNENEKKLLEDILVNKYKIHSSERDWIGYKFDVKIENNGSLDDLKNKVLNLGIYG